MTALLPLTIDVGQFGVAGQHLPAIEAALNRGILEVRPAFFQHEGNLIVVGSGPSLPDFIDELREERAKGRTILACNGAHDLLCEHDLVPDLFLTVDPRDIRHNLRHKNQKTIYLLASRVAPEVFDHLDGCNRMLWHSYGKPDELDFLKSRLPFNPFQFIIGGGSTSGLRAIAVGYFVMGYRNFTLYGFDSCNDAQGRKRFDSGTNFITTPVIVGGRTFTCSMAMAAQANEFQSATYGFMPGIHLEAKGDGLIAAILEERRKQGKQV